MTSSKIECRKLYARNYFLLNYIVLMEILKQTCQLETNRSCTKNPKGHVYIDWTNNNNLMLKIKKSLLWRSLKYIFRNYSSLLWVIWRELSAAMQWTLYQPDMWQNRRQLSVWLWIWKTMCSGYLSNFNELSFVMIFLTNTAHTSNFIKSKVFIIIYERNDTNDFSFYIDVIISFV